MTGNRGDHRSAHTTGAGSRATKGTLAGIVVAALAGATVIGIAAPASASRLQPVVPEPTVPASHASTGSASTGATPADTRVDLTVVLTPRDRAALRDLPARAHGLSAHQRGTRIAGTSPTTSGRARVEAALVDAGFTVSDAGPWNVSASGTVGDAEAVFGVRVVGTGTQMHPVGHLTMPASFGGAATTVLGLDRRLVAVPASVPGTPVSDFRTAYSASANAGAGTTIATVQFSGWNAGDLTAYANAAGTAVPSVTQIPIDGADPTAPSDTNGGVEVALDQETILGNAPAAAQRIYFVNQDAQGVYDAYSRIADDVVAHGITAVSESWGSCEADMDQATHAALEDAIDRIVGAGATMFAAVGDTGASCQGLSGPATSVLYPAASSAVVAVGGTSLTENADGSFSESVWNNSSGSGGGGYASLDSASYQAGTNADPSRGRAVPDIAAEADPYQGPGIYTSSTNGWVLGGGTSLSTPMMAAQLATTLADRGCTSGIGDIHAAIYAHPGDFQDVTSGSNGTYPATAGYDLATGLGSPNWSKLRGDLPVSPACSSTPPVSSTSPTGTPSPTPTGSPTAAPTAAPTQTPAPTPSPTQTPAPPVTGISADGTKLLGATTMTAGQSIHSPSRQYHLDMQADGNLVEYGNGRALWATGTTRYHGAHLALQADGNAVLYAVTGKAVWATGTSGKGAGAVLSIDDHGRLRLTRNGSTLWNNKRPGADTLTPGAVITAGQSIWDSAERRQFVLQTDGNVVVYKDGKAVWSTRTSGRGGAKLTLQSDGNLVLYTKAAKALWSSKTSRFGGSGMKLTQQSDGNLVLYKNGKAVWATGTNR
ncbi:hypothetical protein [Curtobacterium sp. MCBD17_028]|uniref:hypothetical protein n=1 Tax=Curtobacterium sp. MCBD17_028 TaxID=2175670 RepID=UPI000DA7446E|nr:hypothetical protein [Curtobacterium sp. MCBD17_028]PZE29905.1 hypothetical protein DEI86_01045 [Curtobacterium sp. MCBD17_028]